MRVVLGVAGGIAAYKACSLLRLLTEGGHDVTGYAYEPWHLRYVGPRAAWAMHLQGEAYWERFAPVALDAATAG